MTKYAIAATAASVMMTPSMGNVPLGL